MTQLGADPDHLRGLARSLRAAAGRLDDLSIGLTRRIRLTDWRGPDAAVFTQQWQSLHQPAMAAAASTLSDVARRTDREADEQDSASSSGTPVSAGPAPGGSAARPSTLLPLARREDRFQGAVDVRVGPVLGTLSGELTIHHLDGDRRRVVLTQMAGAGAALSAGSSVDVGIGGPAGVGGTTSGGSADARLRAGAILRRSWELDADEIDDLLARVALEQSASSTIHVPDPLTRAASAVDHIVERATGIDPGLDIAARVGAGVPVPRRTEQLVEVELSGAAAMGLGSMAGLGARASGVTALRVGRGDGRAGPTTVVEYQSAATGALTSSLLRRLGISLPPDAHRAVAVRIELPDSDGADLPAPALVRLSTATDTELHDVVARVALGRADAASAHLLAGAVASLGRGDPGAAITQLDQLALLPEQVTVTSTTGTLSGHTARAGLSAGAGLGAGVTLRGHGLRVDRGG